MILKEDEDTAALVLFCSSNTGDVTNEDRDGELLNYSGLLTKISA